MSEEIHTRSHFITIERPLEPQPPKDATPNWCYIGTLMFYDKKENMVWKQEIPEAILVNKKSAKGILKCEVKYHEGFGWQLKATISHEHAKFVYPIILSKIESKLEEE